jgi:ribosome-binding protein aMBF1 (putative translation factor)
MIRTEFEYQEAVQQAKEQQERLQNKEATLQKTLSPEEVARAMAPEKSFLFSLLEEIESYEKLKRGDLGEFQNLRELGRMLIGVRIAVGLSQRQLAEKMGVHESQVSRDERNEYHGITVDRASKLLDVMGVTLKTVVQEPLTSLHSEPSSHH